MDDRTTIPLIDLPRIPEDALRAFINQRSEEIGKGLKTLSLEIGRNETYVQQYVRYGKPKTLGQKNRRCLARALELTADATTISDTTVVLESPQPQKPRRNECYRISPVNHGFDIKAHVTTDADIRAVVRALKTLRKIISLYAHLTK
jgi:hypothetical protein